MANIDLAIGTAIIFGPTVGVNGVTHAMAVGIAQNSARMGPEVDLGASFAPFYSVQLFGDFSSAPTADTLVEAYLATSYDATLWSGGVSGTDSAFTLGTNNINLIQAARSRAAWLRLANATGLQGSPVFLWRPTGRYIVPILWNRGTGQTLQANTRIVVQPLRGVIA